jgi:hypothetical protein
MDISIVLAQVLRAQESVELLLAEEADDTQHKQIAEALEALQRAEVCIYDVLTERSAGLGQRLTPLSYTQQNR